MQQVLFALGLALVSAAAFSQADSLVFDRFGNVKSEPSDTAWKVGGNFGLNISQSTYSNWQAGGENSISLNTLFSVFANYDDGGKWKWFNKAVAAYGLNFTNEATVKTDDRFEVESRVDRRMSKQWNASLLFNFRTQFSDGFRKPGDSVRISTFLAPAYTLLGVGFTYKPAENFSAFISPATAKFTLVNDQQLANLGSFGVEPGVVIDTVDGVINYSQLGKKTRLELGAYANLAYKANLAENIELQLNADFYMNYLNDNFYQFIDINAGMILFMKVNKYISANLALNTIYDHDIKFDVDDDGVADAPRTQFKQVLGVGFAYNFGYQPKKKK